MLPILRPALLLGALLARSAAADVLHVDPDASGLDDGTSWTDAYEDLGVALGAAVPGDTLRLAEGSYAPAGPGGPRSSTFLVPAGVTLEGGYAGLGAADPDRRDPGLFPSVLTGDLDGDDLPGFVNRSDNAHHVVTCAAGPGTTVLDGLAIAAGHADGAASADQVGAGLGASFGASVRLAGCRVGDCYAELEGAGARVEEPLTAHDTRWEGNRLGVGPDSGVLAGAGLFAASAATLVRCTFELNVISGNSPSVQLVVGGGAYVGAGSRVLDGRFTGNEAQLPLLGQAFGGGLHVAPGVAPTEVVRTAFVDNLARSGGEARGGGLDFDDANAHRVVSCLFAGNEARGSMFAQGGGLRLASLIAPGLVAGCAFSGNRVAGIGFLSECHGGGLATGGTTDVRGCTFGGNVAEDEGGGLWAGIEFGGDVVVVANGVLWGNEDAGGVDEGAQLTVAGAVTLTLDRSCVEGLSGALGGVGNIGLDPGLADPDGIDDVPGTADDDLRLSPLSPAIDAGDAALLGADSVDLDCDGDLAEALPLDGDGRVRRVDDPAVVDAGGGAPAPDMGAYERGAGLPVDPWTDLGLGLAGTSGTPILTGAGSLCPAQPFVLRLRSALPGATSLLVLGVSRVDAAFKGGVLVPAPDLVLPLPTGAAGNASAAAAWPDPSASGLELHWQAWVPDPGGPFGFAASNGLRSVAP